MQPKFLCVVAVVAISSGVATRAQLGQDLTLRGEVVEVSCFTKLGASKATGAEHRACALDCVKKGQALGILTDGDGLVKVTGTFAADNYVKLVEYVGQEVEVQGKSARYLDYSRAIDIAKINRTKGSRK